MSGNEVTRREAVMLSGAAALYLLASGQATAMAQPLGKKKKDNDKDDDDDDKKPDLSKLLLAGDSHDWTLKVDVNVNAYVERDGKGMPVSHDFNLATAAIVFPVLKDSASHKTYPATLTSKLTFNDVLIADKPAGFEDKYPCGTRLGRWEIKDKKGREVRLQVDIPMTCWQTRFDIKRASKLTWPGTWPAVPMSTFTDLQSLGADKNGNPVVLINHAAENIKALVKKWTDGKDPRSVAPVALAQFLAGQVLEYIQPSGDGLSFLRNSGFQGFDLIGAEQAVATRRGTEQDVACVLTAVYRAAGLPARVVIGYDLSKERGDDANFLEKRSSSVPLFRTWVEFCLYEESSPKELWVPVDINRQRKISSRNSKNWKYFGDNDDLEYVLPISHQFHPPTTVISHGAPCFWGWLTTPEAQVATQFIRFNSITTPKSINSKREREGKPPATPAKK